MIHVIILDGEVTLPDITEETRKFQKELNAGTTALVLLSVLGREKEPMYGYQIAKMIEAKSGEEPVLKQGALYPVLRALESSNLLESEVEPSVSGPPRRYYRITDTGRQTLARWKDIWARTRNLVDTIIQGEA